VDRGSFSVETMVLLFAWAICDPTCLRLNRGNHESKNMNKLYGFEGEVLHKYCVKTMAVFADVF
jgi:serine/threonine-protein phosphatase 5